MGSVLPIGIIAVLIALNGIFVAAEFSLVGVSRAAVERLAGQGSRAAQLVRHIVHDPRSQDRYLATAQVGITAASLGLGMYGEHTLAQWLAEPLESLGVGRWVAAHALASGLAVAVLTYFHIVLGEMVPKSLALRSAKKTALWISPPMRWIQYLMYPLVVGLNAAGTGILRLAGIRRETSAAAYLTPEEIEYMVEESEAEGLLAPEAGRVLKDVFDFGELTAEEVMVSRVHVSGVPLGAEPGDLAEVLRGSQHTRYPVYEGDLDHICGILHIKDVLRLLREKTPVTREDVRPVPFVPETAELDAVLAAMRREQSQMVVVMDEHGGTAGVATREDLFEEVIGEVDEDIASRPDISEGPAGSLTVQGTVRLDELEDVLETELSHEEVDTVSGLVLSILERPPKVGDVVRYAGLRFEVTAVEGHGVSRCRVRRADGR